MISLGVPSKSSTVSSTTWKTTFVAVLTEDPTATVTMSLDPTEMFFRPRALTRTVFFGTSSWCLTMARNFSPRLALTRTNSSSRRSFSLSSSESSSSSSSSESSSESSCPSCRSPQSR